MKTGQNVPLFVVKHCWKKNKLLYIIHIRKKDLPYSGNQGSGMLEEMWLTKRKLCRKRRAD